MTSPSHERPAADDSTDGLAMFVTFMAAVLIVTGAVGLLAVLPTWWMLAIALGVHAVGTIIVYVLVLLVVSDEPGSAPSGKASVLGRARRAWSRMSHRQWTPGGSGVDARSGARGQS
jgi:cytochrome b subunit of formate dehydrogenase